MRVPGIARKRMPGKGTMGIPGEGEDEDSRNNEEEDIREGEDGDTWNSEEEGTISRAAKLVPFSKGTVYFIIKNEVHSREEYLQMRLKMLGDT